MSVSGSGIAYSSDYGLTWKKLKNPKSDQRFSSIFFNSKKQGIVGSLWNTIGYTDDNCATWKLIPTPFDQKKYDKTNRESRPAINRVAIFKDYLILRQEELIFYSKRDVINWVPLPGYIDFYTDPENSSLFFWTEKGSYIRSDGSLNAIHSFEIATANFDAKCKNGSLFILTKNTMIQLDSNNEIIRNSFPEEKPTVTEPYYIGHTKTVMLGALENKIFRNNGTNNKWEPLFTFPFPVSKDKLTVMEDATILYNPGDESLYYYNLSGKLQKTLSKTTMIADFGKPGINKIIFSQGSSGCFHFYEDQLIYTNLGEYFGGALEISNPDKRIEKMADNDETIKKKDVQDFVENIPALYRPGHTATIEDLAFTTGDYEQCKKDILKFQASLQNNKNEKQTRFNFPRNNLDFNRLLSLVDSVKYIKPDELYSTLITLNTNYSTTTNWKKIELINNNKEVLTITSSYDDPNAFYLPWMIYYNGYSTYSTAIEINQFIKKVYPAFMAKLDKVRVLHSLVKYLYIK